MSDPFAVVFKEQGDLFNTVVCRPGIHFDVSPDTLQWISRKTLHLAAFTLARKTVNLMRYKPV